MFRIIDALTLPLNRSPGGLHIRSAWKRNWSIYLCGWVLNSVHGTLINYFWSQKQLAAINTAFKRIYIQCIEILDINWIIHLLLHVFAHLHHFILLFLFQPNSKFLIAGFDWWYSPCRFGMLIRLSKKYRLLILHFFIHLIKLFLLIIFVLVCSRLVIVIDGICRHPTSHHRLHIHLHFIASACALRSWLLLTWFELVQHWVLILVLDSLIFRNEFVYLLSLNL